MTMHEHARGGMHDAATAGLRLPLGHLPGTRYPDVRVQSLDKRFTARVGNALGLRASFTKIDLMYLAVDDLSEMNRCRLGAEIAFEGIGHVLVMQR